MVKLKTAQVKAAQVTALISDKQKLVAEVSRKDDDAMAYEVIYSIRHFYNSVMIEASDLILKTKNPKTPFTKPYSVLALPKCRGFQGNPTGLTPGINAQTVLSGYTKGQAQHVINFYSSLITYIDKITKDYQLSLAFERKSFKEDSRSKALLKSMIH